MVTKREFNRIKRENPESRIWQRTRKEQKVRNELAKTLIKAKKSWVETPYEEYTGRLTKEKQKIEWEKNKILQEIDDLAQKKERDSQQIWKELDSLKQQKEQEKMFLKNNSHLIEDVNSQTSLSWRLWECSHGCILEKQPSAYDIIPFW